MNVTIRFKGFESSEAAKTYLEERAKKLIKFLPPTTTVNATLEDDKVRKIVELTLRHKGAEYVVKQESDNLTTSIDDAVDKLMRQLSRAKDKKQKKHTGVTKEVVEM